MKALPDLRRKLTEEVVPKIQEVFNQKKLNALIEDYEIFDKKLKGIESEQVQIRRSGQETFAAQKTRYKSLLRDQLGVERGALLATYSFDDHQASYDALYHQVWEKIEARSNELEQRIHDIYADLLKVTKIQQFEDERRAAELHSQYNAIKAMPEEIRSHSRADVVGLGDTIKGGNREAACPRRTGTPVRWLRNRQCDAAARRPVSADANQSLGSNPRWVVRSVRYDH